MRTGLHCSEKKFPFAHPLYREELIVIEPDLESYAVNPADELQSPDVIYAKCVLKILTCELIRTDNTGQAFNIIKAIFLDVHAVHAPVFVESYPEMTTIRLTGHVVD
jgi:hypothetical protein